jgi:DNA repair protein RecN (Recombination protein N)
MPGGRFEIQLEATPEEKITPYGLERCEFMVSANPGQPLQALAKVASGGELSRISLAIQVIAAQSNVTPTLIFDEVDVGIGGGTAAIVGQLLHKLGNTAQVLCVTHLPQVAAHGKQHLLVQKITEKDHTHTRIKNLNAEEKVHEIARMLGGVKITQQTLAHAKEMLEMTD